MPIKFTVDMKAEGTGVKSFSWSESHYLPGEVKTLSAFYQQASDLGNKRAGFLAGNCEVTRVRLSLVGSPRCSDFILATGNGVTGSQLMGLGALGAENSDQPNACIQVDLEGATSDLNGRVFCAGIPDTVIRTGTGVGDQGPGPFLAVPGFKEGFDTWKAFLINNGWMFKCRQFSPPTVIVDWSNEPAAPFRLIAMVDLTNANAFTPKAGDRVQIRGVRMVDPRSRKPTGQYAVVGTTTGAGTVLNIVLQGTAGYAAENILSHGTIEKVAYQYAPIKAAYVSGQTTRKRGVGSARPRGRSQVRPRSPV